MSGSVTAAYVFAEADRIDVRRFCGFPPYGTGVVIFPEPWFFRYYLALEARLSNLTPGEGAVVMARLAELRTLETAVPGAGDNLDTDQAAVWHHNKSEVRDRMNLYRQWRLELCNILGIPPGPHLKVAGIRLRV